jgi:hypothetical protein
MENMQIDGYYWDGSTSWIIYKDNNGKSIMVKNENNTN